MKGKRFNCVYKGHFNVFETLLLNNACYPSEKLMQSSTVFLKKSLDVQVNDVAGRACLTPSFPTEDGGGRGLDLRGFCKIHSYFLSHQNIGLQGGREDL